MGTRRRVAWLLRDNAYRDFWMLIITAVVVFALVQIDTESSSTNRALCTLRGDLERRVKSSRDFLHEHPNGILGIPATTLRTSIDNQQRTINALQDLRCE